MTIDEAIKFFNKLRSQTTKKSELKIYDDFIQTLTRLSKRVFSIEDIISIETKLDALQLNLNDENRKKHFRKVFNSFKEYLKPEFSLVSKGYYTAIGMCFGVAFGSAIEKTIGTSSGLAIGMLIGLVIGRIMDTKAEKEGKVL